MAPSGHRLSASRTGHLVYVVKPCLAGRANQCRYADDWVCAFQYRQDAPRYFEVLPKRLQRLKLAAAPSKIKISRFSRIHPSHTFCFLGFEFYWCKDRSGTVRVQKRTAPKKQRATLERIKAWVKSKRHLPKRLFFAALNLKFVGHYNYYYVSSNARSVWSYYGQVMKHVLKWLNRRSQRKSYSWVDFKHFLHGSSYLNPLITLK